MRGSTTTATLSSPATAYRTVPATAPIVLGAITERGEDHDVAVAVEASDGAAGLGDLTLLTTAGGNPEPPVILRWQDGDFREPTVFGGSVGPFAIDAEVALSVHARDEFGNSSQAVLPFAHAGADREVECTSPAGALVTLDGSLSTGGSSSVLTWAGAFGTASGTAPAVQLPLGSNLVDLTVEDSPTFQGTDRVEIDVVDTMAPDLSVPVVILKQTSLSAGDDFFVDATVENVGHSNAGVTMLRYYLSTDSTIDNSDTEIGSELVGHLAPGGISPENSAVTLFERDRGGPGNWGEVATLIASEGAGGDLFGGAVAISGDTLVVGARADDDVFFSSGSAYVFERQDGAWFEKSKLTASDAAAKDFFGKAIAIAGAVVLVSASGDDDAGSGSGSAYVFERRAEVWTEVAKLTASDAAQADQFGISVAVSGDTAVVGAYLNDDAGSASGSAYLFQRRDSGEWRRGSG